MSGDAIKTRTENFNSRLGYRKLKSDFDTGNVFVCSEQF